MKTWGGGKEFFRFIIFYLKKLKKHTKSRVLLVARVRKKNIITVFTRSCGPIDYSSSHKLPVYAFA